MWGADWKFRHEGNCSASWGLPSDAEQLPEWQNFQFALRNHYGFFFLHTLPSTIAFRLEYVLFNHFYAKITTVFIKKSLVWLLFYTLMSKCLAESDVKMSKITSKSTYWHHARHPSCKTTFPSPGQVHGNPGRVCKKSLSEMWETLHDKTIQHKKQQANLD